jgi:hypothetical protein
MNFRESKKIFINKLIKKALSNNYNKIHQSSISTKSSSPLISSTSTYLFRNRRQFIRKFHIPNSLPYDITTGITPLFSANNFAEICHYRATLIEKLNSLVSGQFFFFFFFCLFKKYNHQYVKF